jgi:peptidyl-prolyl cis-trans isomerase SurA
MSFMRNSSIIAALCLAIILSAGLASAELVDRIVASVNGEIVTLRELEQRLEPIVRINKITSEAEKNDLRRKLLQNMVDRLLIMQEGQRQGVTVSERELDRAIQDLMADRNLTPNELQRQIREKGGTMVQFREDLRADIVRQRLLAKEVHNRIVVTDEEIVSFLRAQGYTGSPGAAVPSDEPPPEGAVRVRNIFLGLPEAASEDDVRARLKEAARIKAEIEGGLDFKSAAARYSEGENAAQGGNMGNIAWTDMNERIQAALRNLKPGQVSQPIVLGPGVQLFQVVEREAPVEKASEAEETLQIPEEEKERVRRMLSEKKLQARFQEWVKELRSRAYIKINL